MTLSGRKVTVVLAPGFPNAMGFMKQANMEAYRGGLIGQGAVDLLGAL